MSFKNIRSGDNPFAFESLGQWAKELGVPARSLLHHSANGHFPVFTLPPRDVDYYLVHEEFLGRPVLDPGPAPMLSAQGAMGLILNNRDVTALAAGKHVEISEFHALIRKSLGWTEITPPIPDKSGRPDRNDGWQVIAFRRAPEMSAPVKLKITPNALYVRNMDVAALAQSLLSGQFVEDLLVAGKVVEDLPPYVSHKLQELIDANRLYWRNHLDINPSERERRRSETKRYLQENFRAHCDKKSSPMSLLSFAAYACEPSSDPESQQLSESSVTPHLLALLTAARLFWSPHLSYEAGHPTYPGRESMEDFMRFMGVRNQNMPIAATTVIRPEGVPTPVKPKPFADRLLKRRQALSP